MAKPDHSVARARICSPFLPFFLSEMEPASVLSSVSYKTWVETFPHWVAIFLSMEHVLPIFILLVKSYDICLMHSKNCVKILNLYKIICRQKKDCEERCQNAPGGHVKVREY